MKIYVKLMQSTLCLTFQTAFKTQCIVKKKKNFDNIYYFWHKWVNNQYNSTKYLIKDGLTVTGI